MSATDSRPLSAFCHSLLSAGHTRHGAVCTVQAHHVHVCRDELLLFLELEPPARLPLGLHPQLPQILRQVIHGAGYLLHPLTGAPVLLPDELHTGLGAQVDLATLRAAGGRVLVTPLAWLTVYLSGYLSCHPHNEMEALRCSRRSGPSSPG